MLAGTAGGNSEPVAAVAYYGPDHKVPVKIAVGIFEAEGADVIVERWRGPDVATNPQVAEEIDAYLQAHNVQQVALTGGIIGCPHEEAIDFPAGQECPHCPCWKGKQGIRAQ